MPTVHDKRNKLAVILIYFSLISGCSENRVETVKTFYSIYDSGWKIKVTKVEIRYSKRFSFGYNQRSDYKYSFILSPNNIVWTGYMGAEPKYLLRCADALYLRYIQHNIE